MLASWLNGVAAASPSVEDRGLQYGDGLFETMRVGRGGVRLVERHLARLSLGCTRLGIEPPPLALVHRELAAAAAVPGAGVVKLIVTRGAGGRGYRAPAPAAPTRLVLAYPPPEHPAGWAEDGISLRYCATRLAIQPLLAGLKHLNRLEQVCARNEWTGVLPQEGLMQDTDGRVVCGTMTNVFVVHGDTWRTPPVTRCGVAGVMRETIMAAAARAGVRCIQSDLTRADLAAAEQIFLTNAVIGVWPVRDLEGDRRTELSAARQVKAWIADLA